MILPYVYKLTHRETGEFYIGFRKSNKVKSEFDLGFKYFSSSKKVKQIGFENFNIEIIAEFFNANDAYLFEQELIKENWNNNLILNKFYHNGKKVFKIGMSGKKHSIESKKKMSNSTKGKNHPFYGKNLSEDTKNKIGRKGSLHWAYGKKFSDEIKNKMSISRIGEKNGFYNKKHSEEAKRKISEKNKSYYSIKENHPFYGKKHSDASKEKIRQRNKIFSDSEEIEIYILYVAGFSTSEIHELYYKKAHTKTIRKTFNKVKNKWPQ